ncbi:MAG: CCDC90 family protein [Magnetococcus sp. XQGC-1]
MTAITFDTFKFIRRLKEAGIPENQAEAISEAIKETHVAQSEEFAAQQDLKKLEGALATKADVAQVDIHILELKRDIVELECRMTIRLGLMLITACGMLFAALRYFPPTQPIIISNRPVPAIEQGTGNSPAAASLPAPYTPTRQ